MSGTSTKRVFPRRSSVAKPKPLKEQKEMAYENIRRKYRTFIEGLPSLQQQQHESYVLMEAIADGVRKNKPGCAESLYRFAFHACGFLWRTSEASPINLRCLHQILSTLITVFNEDAAREELRPIAEEQFNWPVQLSCNGGDAKQALAFVRSINLGKRNPFARITRAYGRLTRSVLRWLTVMYLIRESGRAVLLDPGIHFPRWKVMTCGEPDIVGGLELLGRELPPFTLDSTDYYADAFFKATQPAEKLVWAEQRKAVKNAVKSIFRQIARIESRDRKGGEKQKTG